MLVKLYVGAITDPKAVMVDTESTTLQKVINDYSLSGEITFNGASISRLDKTKTLAELGVQNGDYLCSARKNGGN